MTIHVLKAFKQIDSQVKNRTEERSYSQTFQDIWIWKLWSQRIKPLLQVKRHVTTWDIVESSRPISLGKPSSQNVSNGPFKPPKLLAITSSNEFHI